MLLMYLLEKLLRIFCKMLYLERGSIPVVHCLFFFHTLCLQPFIHIWGFLDLLTKLCEILACWSIGTPVIGSFCNLDSHVWRAFHLQSLFWCHSSCPLASCFFVSLILSTWFYFIFLLLTQSTSIFTISPQANTSFWPVMHVCVCTTVFHLIASYISPKLRISGMPFSLTVLGERQLWSHTDINEC